LSGGLDRTSLKPGEKFRDTTQEAIEKSALFIPLISKNTEAGQLHVHPVKTLSR
jgi:hypothetical protein